MLEQVADGTWQIPVQGVSLDPTETVTAVLACVTHAADLRAALIQAIGFGGDTDTVAAIVGGILGAGLTRDEVLAELPWHPVVLLPDADDIAGIAASLAAARDSSSS